MIPVYSPAFPVLDDPMLTDWLKIMMDEIARKQAELESARAEQELRERERSVAQQPPASKSGATKSARRRRQ
jgi:hypothetical protein